MRNRAKCKLCESIIESFHNHDYVTCKCGEISVDGGTSYYKASAIDWRNFLRVDDEGNEIIVSVIEKEGTQQEHKEVEKPPKPTYEDLLKMLDNMIKSYEELPPAALYSNINHYDLLSVLLLLSEIFRASSCNKEI